jgi:phospholipid/cholesterol/gamma-HCH transport system substrate-binding protein
MSTRAQKIRLGVFMILATLLFLGSVGVLAGLKFWNPRDRYFVRFTDSISGLEVGSTVKMKGVRVGQVEQIKIGADVESVEVVLSINPTTPIPIDTEAVMTSIGITGLKFIELTGGSSKAKRLAPNTPQSHIKVGKSTLESLTGHATDIAVKTEALLNNLLRLTDEDNRVRVKRLLDNADRLMVAWEEMASTNRGRVKRILGNVDRTTGLMEKAGASVSRLADESAPNVREALAQAAGAARAVNKAVVGLNPQSTLNAISGAANSVKKRIEDPGISQAIGSLAAAANKISTLSVELGKVVRQRDRQLGSVLEHLDRASANLKEFSRQIKERPSLLLRGDTLKERKVP